jgi:hypothetical protein
MRGGVEETFRPQEESRSSSDVERQAQSLDQWIDGVITLGRVILEVAVSSLAAKSVVRCNGFQEG